MKDFIKTFLRFLSSFAFSFALLVGGSFILIRALGFKLGPEKRVLVLGDSHTQCAVDDQVMSSAINFSESGSTYFYVRSKLRTLLENNPQLDTVLLSFHHGSLDTDNENDFLENEAYIMERLPTYLPMMNAVEMGYFMDRPEWYKALAQVPLSAAVYLLNSWRNPPIDISDYGIGAYSMSSRNKLEEDIALRELKPSFKKKDAYSHKELDFLKDIRAICDKHRVVLILLNTPVYKVSKYTDISLYESVIKTELSDFWVLDMSTDSIPREGFGDISHLNHTGAGIFTRNLQRRLSDSSFQ